MRLLLFLALSQLVAANRYALADESPLAAPLMTIQRESATLTVSGSASSVAHIEIISATTSRLFPGETHTLDLQIGNGLPARWSLITEMALRTMANVHSGTVTVSASELEVTGYARDSLAWVSSLARLKTSIADTMRLKSHVRLINVDASLGELCIQLANAALREQKIEFVGNSPTLRTTAYHVLDELAELTTDCPSTTIWISVSDRGNTAAQDLVRQRGQSIAAYLSRIGLSENRRVVRRGSAAAGEFQISLNVQEKAPL